MFCYLAVKWCFIPLFSMPGTFRYKETLSVKKKVTCFSKTILIFMQYTIFVLTGSQKWMIFIFTINCLYFIEFIIIMVASHHSSGKFGCTQP